MARECDEHPFDPQLTCEACREYLTAMGQMPMDPAVVKRIMGEAQRVLGLKDGDKDWVTACQCCEATPTVHPTQLCGPCCFGEAETAGGNW